MAPASLHSGLAGGPLPAVTLSETRRASQPVKENPRPEPAKNGKGARRISAWIGHAARDSPLTYPASQSFPRGFFLTLPDKSGIVS